MGPETRRHVSRCLVLDSHGFTLLELLVALAVSAVVILGVRAAVSLSVDVATRGRDVTDEALRVEAVRATVRRWLESAYIGSGLEGSGFEGRDQEVLGQPQDVLAFVTLDPALLDTRRGSAVWIRLRVASGDSGLVAEYHDVAWNPLPAGDMAVNRRNKRISILPEVRALDVRYLVTLGDESRWFRGWSSGVRLPRAVELRLYTASEETASAGLELPLLAALARQG